MVFDFAQLSLAERIQLVEDLWDTIAAIPGAVLLTDAQKAEIDHRLGAYQSRSADGSSWLEVKAALLRQSQRC